MGERIEKIDSYQVIQASGRIDIINGDRELIVSFDMQENKINFRRNVFFFNENDELFASFAQNVSNPEILDLISTIGIDIKAPTFKIDYMDGNEGKLVGIGPDGLLKVAELPDVAFLEDLNVPGSPLALAKDVEHNLGIGVTLTSDVVNPELTVYVTTNENENKDYRPILRAYEGATFKGRGPTININKDEIGKFSQSFKLIGTYVTGSTLSFTLESNRDIVLIDAYMTMKAKNV